MLLIFSFITWKLAMLVATVITYLWPFIFPLLGLGCAYDCGGTKWSKTTKGVVIGVSGVLFLVVYLAYLGWIHEPGYSIPNSINGKLTQSWDEYVKQEELDEARKNITRTDLGVEVRRFKLLAYNPPKHFYVTLQAEDGSVMKSVYVSKHCNNHRQLQINEEYNLEVMKYTLSSTPGQVHYEFKGLYNAFCS
jgi:hypothetical protein